MRCQPISSSTAAALFCCAALCTGLHVRGEGGECRQCTRSPVYHSLKRAKNERTVQLPADYIGKGTMHRKRLRAYK